MRKRFLAGNWKMFKSISEAGDFATELKEALADVNLENKIVAVCAPYLQLAILKEKVTDSHINIGAQNVHFEKQGAFTGEISVPMLEEISVDYCIIGHSERREYFAETDETINKKLHKVLESSIDPIVCVGENLQDRKSGSEFQVVEKQLRGALKDIKPEFAKRMTIAYEPVWAIGTGETATPQQAQDMCAFVRRIVGDVLGIDAAKEILVQYGGSVKPANAKEILEQPDIDGALIGGASLKVKDFMDIIEA